MARGDAQLDRTLLGSPRLAQQEWREVVLLLAGVLNHLGPQRVDGMFKAVLGLLGSKAKLDHKARLASLLGSVLYDLSPSDYRPPDDRYSDHLLKVMAVFDARRSRQIPIDQAVAAAEAIGQADDPRFLDLNSPALWVKIPAGTFWMGAQKKDPEERNYDPEARGEEDPWSEAPVHRVKLGAYHVGRYPVIVAQYRRFVEEGGVRKREVLVGGGLREERGAGGLGGATCASHSTRGRSELV